MSSEIAIDVANISKCFNLYAAPSDRLKQSIVPKINKLIGRKSNNYYKEFWALNDISFNVKKGESVGIIGKNGSGKSTLLQIITGNLAPTNGIVKTTGRVAALLELGSGFNPEFTGRENVFINGALLGLSKSYVENCFDSIASFADIGDFIDQPVKTYSSGMFVRLAFAVQIQLNPDILIVDEALAVGDALFQKRCYQRIQNYINNGGTLLFVSHDFEVMRTMTTKAVLLDKGFCKAVGPSSEVVLGYRKILHEAETTGFLVENQVNSTPKESTFPSDGVLLKHLSFGDFDVLIDKVILFKNGTESHKDTIYPGDSVKIKLVCKVNKTIEHLAFGIRVRNKEGVKVYSGSSFANDINNSNKNPKYEGIWHKKFVQGQIVSIDMSFECNLGEGLYEVQAFVCEEQLYIPGFQRMLHWLDEALFFVVSIDKSERWFGGVCDLNIKYELDCL